MRVADKAVRAAVGRDEIGVLRAVNMASRWSRQDMFRLCSVVADRAADTLAEVYAVPLGAGWVVGEDALSSPTSAQRFAAVFLVASANLDEEGRRLLWGHQVEDPRMLVIAMVGHVGELYQTIREAS